MHKILILGGGSWGCTIAKLLAEKNNKITIWEFEKDKVEYINKNRLHPHLKGFKLLENMEIYSNSKNFNVEEFEYIILAVPAQYIRANLTEIALKINKDAIIVNLSKGIEVKSLKFLSQVINEILPSNLHNNVCMLYGPTFADEIITHTPSVIVAASHIKKTREAVKKLFRTNFLKVVESDDVHCVEISAALKNCVAIGCGILDGLGHGYNTKAALITIGLNEIYSIAKCYGGKLESILGFACIGDLVATCISQNSRNRYLGERLGKNETLENILSEMPMIAEGVETIKAAYIISKNLNLNLSLFTCLYDIIVNKKEAMTILRLITE